MYCSLQSLGTEGEGIKLLELCYEVGSTWVEVGEVIPLV